MRGQKEQNLGTVITPLAVTALAATAPFLWLPGLLFEECTLSLLWEGAAECPVVISPASAVCSDPL